MRIMATGMHFALYLALVFPLYPFLQVGSGYIFFFLIEWAVNRIEKQIVLSPSLDPLY